LIFTIKSIRTTFSRYIRGNIIFQHDGAPAHNSHIVRDYLNAQLQNRWLGTYGPIEWPPRSPDLTPLDFFYGHT